MCIFATVCVHYASHIHEIKMDNIKGAYVKMHLTFKKEQ